MSLNDRFKYFLGLVHSKIGRGVTSGGQLDKFAKTYIPRGYRGIYSETDPIPRLKNNEFIIKNVPHNTHWIAVFKLNGTLYEYDSFGRDMLGARYKDFNRPNDNLVDQRFIQMDCGQRVLSILMSLFV